MQGQVPASDAKKDDGYCLNADILAIHPIQSGTSRGGMARLGKCVYVGSDVSTADDGSEGGLAAVDLSNPRRPKVVQVVPGVSAAWDTVHVNAVRKILVAKVPTGFQVMSIATRTCRLTPRGTFDISMFGPTPLTGFGTGRLGATLGADAIHEFQVSPDGRTVVAGFCGFDLGAVEGTDDDGLIFDITDLDRPRLIANFSPAAMLHKDAAAHDFDFSPDGKRLYIGISIGYTGGPPRTEHPTWDGVIITDISAIAARRPGAKPRVISYLPSAGGHTVRYAKIGGHPYLLSNYENDCVMGVPAYTPAGIVIIDIANERKPRVASNFTLEVNASIENCTATANDGTFVHAHFTNVDDRLNTTMLFADWTNSGLRVIDIRNPLRPREIAYANPVVNKAKAYSYPTYDAKTRVVTYADSANGLVVVKLNRAAQSRPGRAVYKPAPRDPLTVARLQATRPGMTWICSSGVEGPVADHARHH